MAEASPRIAIVDDDPAVLKALSRLLRTHSFHARTFVSGQELLAALPTGLPECLIVDLQMPEIRAAESLRYAQGVGVRMTRIVHPGLLVETGRFHYKRFSLPMANRIAQPCWLRLFGQRAAVGKDLAVVIHSLEEHHDRTRQLEGAHIA